VNENGSPERAHRGPESVLEKIVQLVDADTEPASGAVAAGPLADGLSRGFGGPVRGHQRLEGARDATLGMELGEPKRSLLVPRRHDDDTFVALVYHHVLEHRADTEPDPPEREGATVVVVDLALGLVLDGSRGHAKPRHAVVVGEGDRVRNSHDLRRTRIVEHVQVMPYDLYIPSAIPGRLRVRHPSRRNQMASSDPFPQALRTWRRQAGVSQAELDAALEKTPGTITQIEAGRLKPPDRATCMVLAAALGAPASDVWRLARDERLRLADAEAYADLKADLERGETTLLDHEEELILTLRALDRAQSAKEGTVAQDIARISGVLVACLLEKDTLRGRVPRKLVWALARTSKLPTTRLLRLLLVVIKTVEAVMNETAPSGRPGPSEFVDEL
jgi:transcriptional regulator with XRE-family HTH domain